MTFTSSDPNFTILMGDEQLQTLRLHRLYREWSAIARGGALPQTGFLDPARYGYLDGMLVIIDVEADGERRRYRYRSVGRHFIEHMKVDPAGIYMDQHPESSFAVQAMRACDLVVQTRRPVHARIDRMIDGRHFTVEFLLLPVADGDDAVATLLIAQIFTPA